MGLDLHWEVTSQQRATGTDAQGLGVRGWNVYYRTPDGLTGDVFVPETSYTPDNVRQLIRDHLANHSAIANLSE